MPRREARRHTEKTGHLRCLPATLIRSISVSSATLSSSIADVTSRIQDTAGDAFRAGRTATADTLEGAAAGISAGGERVNAVAQSAAETLGAGAKYVRKHDGRDMVDDIESLIKRHPGKALIGALVLGFFAGRAIRRD
jgi:hypothetical protein